MTTNTSTCPDWTEADEFDGPEDFNAACEDCPVHGLATLLDSPCTHTRAVIDAAQAIIRCPDCGLAAGIILN